MDHIYDNADLSWEKQNQELLELICEGNFGAVKEEEAGGKAGETDTAGPSD